MKLENSRKVAKSPPHRENFTLIWRRFRCLHECHRLFCIYRPSSCIVHVIRIRKVHLSAVVPQLDERPIRSANLCQPPGRQYSTACAGALACRPASHAHKTESSTWRSSLKTTQVCFSHFMSRNSFALVLLSQHWRFLRPTERDNMAAPSPFYEKNTCSIRADSGTSSDNYDQATGDVAEKYRGTKNDKHDMNVLGKKQELRVSKAVPATIK